MFPRTDSDGNPKLFEELGNRPTFSVGAAFPTWRINPETGKREAAYASNVSVATCTQGLLEVDEVYQSVGEVWATVWANSQGRIQYSLVAEGFKKAVPEGESK